MTANELIAWIEGYVSNGDGICNTAISQILTKIGEYKKEEEKRPKENEEMLRIFRKWNCEGMPQNSN